MALLTNERSSHLVTQTRQALDQLPFYCIGSAVVKVFNSFLVIGLTGGHHVIKDHEDAVPDGHCCSFGSSPFAQAPILLAQIRLGTGGAMGRLNQCRLHIWVRWARSPALALACTFLMTRTDPSPGREVSRIGKAGEIESHFRAQQMQGVSTDSRDLFQALKPFLLRGQLSSVEYNFAALTNKFFAHWLERGQRSQLKRHSSEMVLPRNFSKQ